MMMKKKSNPWARAKYLYVLPVAAICAIACTQSPKSADNADEQASVNQLNAEEVAKLENSSETTQVEMKEIFQVVEEMPEFPGGMGECLSFLNKNLKYPTICQENGVQGRVIVQFVITKEGDVVNPRVVRGVDPHLDAEALRVIKMMPKWKPGKQRGKDVNVHFTLPITFSLQ